MNAMDRFWTKVDKTDGCWIWMGFANPYGTFTPHRGGKQIQAHRFTYEMTFGLIPPGLQIDHLCREPLCVRPDHLEAVTPQENNRRSNNPTGVNSRKTHCVHGHEFTPENTYQRLLPNGTEARQCRQCNLDKAWLSKPVEQRRRNQYTDQPTCKWGHAFDGVDKITAARTCSTCRRNYFREYKKRKRAEAKA